MTAGRETLAVHSQSQIISEYRLRALSRKDRDVWQHPKGATDLTLGVVVASRHEDEDLLVVQPVHLMSCRGGCPRHELPARGPPSCAQFDRSDTTLTSNDGRAPVGQPTPRCDTPGETKEIIMTAAAPSAGTRIVVGVDGSEPSKLALS